MDLVRTDLNELELSKSYVTASNVVRTAVDASLTGNALKSPEMTLKFLAAEIAAACTRVGQKDMPPERYALMKSDLADWIDRRAKNWTPEEISLALKQGALTSPDVKHITSPVLIKWLEAYMSETRREAFALIRKFQQEKRANMSDPKKMTPEESEQFIENAYQRYLKDSVRLAWSIVYDHMEKLGHLKLTPDQKRDLIDRAKFEAEKRIQTRTGYLSDISRARLKLVRDADPHKPDSLPEFLIVDAKHIAVGDVFRNWKIAGRGT